MLEVARLPARDRNDLFSEAAARMGVRPVITEKDFWVCVALKILFSGTRFQDHLVFKGGTSLSKVYRLIERFSEDIDLVLDWKLIGFGEGLRDPMRDFPSKTQQDKFNKEVNRLAAEFISGTLAPELNAILAASGAGLSAEADPSDPHVVNIRYPAAFSEAYIRPEVRLEIGPLASWVPSAIHPVRPYAAEFFPNLFREPSCHVRTIAAERTFWEKAAILHQEAHRQGVLPKRHSRHYYDLLLLARSPVREAAFANPGLLHDVVAFKQRFYPSPWARYDLAVPGTFRLLPSQPEQLANLERDYRDMGVMLFGNVPAFSEIVEGLGYLEQSVNSGSTLAERTA